MAHDLGERLLPAFSTPTGMPYSRVRFVVNYYLLLMNIFISKTNLRHGVPKGESVESCESCDVKRRPELLE